MKIERFEDLECWQEARILVRMVYEAINKNEKFKRDYKLSTQAADASVSAMSNIAEGFSRHSNKDLFNSSIFQSLLPQRFKVYFM